MIGGNRKVLLEHAIEIGDHLIITSTREKDGLSWETFGYNTRTGKLEKQRDPTLYSGVAGIVVFFIELWKHTQDSKYLAILEGGGRWIADHIADHSENDAFYTGRLGSIYVLLKISEIDGLAYFQDIALTKIRTCQPQKNITSHSHDLLSGTAGSIVMLLLLYDKCPQPWILNHIDQYIHILLADIRITKTGISWGRRYDYVRSLCGFSHGNAGIAFTWEILGAYFGNEVFSHLSDLSMKYENKFYDAYTWNWPDFRMNGDSVQLKKDIEKYASGNFHAMSSGGNMIAWCHGATGIAFSRLYAYKMRPKEYLKNDIDNAIKAIKHKYDQTDLHLTSTLCHGIGGDALLLAECYRMFNNQECLDMAWRLAKKAMDSKAMTGIHLSGYAGIPNEEDQSLLMGNAGIGYLYLKLIDLTLSPNILWPHLCREPRNVSIPPDLKFLNLSTHTLHSLIVDQVYPQSSKSLSPDYVEVSGDYSKNPLQTINQFRTTVKSNKNIPSTIRYTTVLEYKRFLLDLEVDNWYLLHVKESYYKRLSSIANGREDIMNGKFYLQLNDSVRLFKNIKLDRFTLMRTTPMGVSQLGINRFCFDVLKHFAEAKPASRTISEMMSTVSATPEHRETIEKAIVDQIMAAVDATILIIRE